MAPNALLLVLNVASIVSVPDPDEALPAAHLKPVLLCVTVAVLATSNELNEPTN